MFFQHIANAYAIDLGTNNTLVYAPNKGIVLDEPTSIAFDSIRQAFFGSGVSAHQIAGKNPKHIEVMNPLSQGAITNLNVAKAYIKEVIRRISNHRWFKPIIVVSVPSDLSSMERNAVIEAAKEGGARDVLLIKDPFSAVLGSKRAIDKPEGVLVLDMGAGVTEISLLSCNGLVMSKSIRIAGNDIDQAIMEYFKNHKRILMSSRDAETLKKSLADMLKNPTQSKIINVKNLITRMPESYEVHAHDVRLAIRPIADKIVALTHAMLSSLPPSFASDVYDGGIILTGGTSMLYGIEEYLSSQLDIAIVPAQNPLHTIVLGAGRAIEEKSSHLFGI